MLKNSILYRVFLLFLRIFILLCRIFSLERRDVHLNVNILELHKKFLNISSMGWIKSLRSGSTGVGYTFESLIDKVEDTLSLPDFKGIEIKTHRKNSKSHVSLFNCNPSGNDSYELKRIFDSYCYYNPTKKIKSLNTSVYCDCIIDVGIHYKFSLKVDREQCKVFLRVFDRLGYFIEESSYWSFDVLREKLYSKMSYLAVVQADSKFCGKAEYFKYTNIRFYKIKSFDSFIKLLENGKIRVTFTVSGYSNPEMANKIKNHGTSFNISFDDISLLYDCIDISNI